MKPRVSTQTKQSKRPRNSDDTVDISRPAKKSGVYDSHLQKMDELEEILDKLKSKHKESKHTPEQQDNQSWMISRNFDDYQYS